MRNCRFIEIETGTDRIVSYACGDLDDIESVIVMRTPEYEHLLPRNERGAHVSCNEDIGARAFNMVREITVSGRRVRIKGSRRDFDIDCAGVEQEKWDDSLDLLRLMAADGAFVLDIS